MPLNKLILFDIDGTLVRADRSISSAVLKNTIRTYVAKGVLFGINTNRPIEEALPLYRTLRLNGPMIVEDGAGYKLDAFAPCKIAVRGLRKINRKVINFLQHWVKTRTGDKFTLRIGRDKSYLSDARIPLLILITPQRIFTASIYVRVNGRINPRALQAIYELLKKEFLRGYKGVVIKKIESQGKIIMANSRINRFSTIHRISCHFLKFYDILMISDEEPIPLKFVPRIQFASVSNGTAAYKRECAYVSVKDGANGIVWLIKKFLAS